MGKGLGTGMLDKMVNGAFLGKRQMGRPLKYSFKTRGRAGYVTINLLKIKSIDYFGHWCNHSIFSVFDHKFQLFKGIYLIVMIFNIDGLN